VRPADRIRNLTAHLRRVATDERIRSAAVTYGRLDYAGAEIHMRVTSRPEFHRLRSCAKEPWTVRWIEQYLQPGDVMYDIGANVGAYTLVAAAAVPTARIVAFEPEPTTFAALCDNLELNEVSERVIAMPVALGSSPRMGHLHREEPAPGATARLGGRWEAWNGAPIMVERLDDLVERFDLPTPNHIKLDVDGTELGVLAGAVGILASGGVRSVMVELDRERGGDVADRLAAGGFELAEQSADSGRARSLPSYGLFLRK
jgi:FkbM family methyltransferase